MSGIIGKKLGMTSIFTEDGKSVACTLVEAGPCVVTQVRNDDKDGYNAVQLGYGERKEKRTSKALKGHFDKAKTTPKAKLLEDVFVEGDFLDAIGTSKGKGFQGVVKRHGFGGVGQSTHGQHNRLRAPGAIGACSFPARVFKGLKMAGRAGGRRVKVLNLRVLKMYSDKNLMLVSGSVPGANNSYVILEK